MMVYIKDAVEIGYCIKGIKEFCKRHNIDFRNFVAHGIEADILLKTEDAMAIKVVEYASNRRSEGE